jgi:glucokinase
MYLGIEIGGTKLQLGLGRGDGKLTGLWRGKVDPARGAEGIRQQILQAVPQLLHEAGVAGDELRGAGIGFGGPVDDATHTVIKSHQIEGWDRFPLAAWVTDLVGCPAVLGNDADVAGLGEALFGAGKGLSPIYYITIGSGIGGGLILDGEIYRGCGRGAAEIGHLRVWHREGNDWKCDILEHVASGWALQQRARASTVTQVLAAAEQGDPLALGLLRHAWEALAEGVCHVIALLCPRRIVIGGGVSLMGEKHLFQPLRQLVAERVFRPFADSYEIVPAALGEEVVVHGALALARRHHETGTNS